jgi:hypothetical protein
MFVDVLIIIIKWLTLLECLIGSTMRMVPDESIIYPDWIPNFQRKDSHSFIFLLFNNFYNI